MLTLAPPPATQTVYLVNKDSGGRVEPWVGSKLGGFKIFQETSPPRHLKEEPDQLLTFPSIFAVKGGIGINGG